MLYRLGPHGSSAAPAWGAPLDPRGFIVLTLCYVMLCYAMSLHVCMYVCVYIYIYIYISNFILYHLGPPGSCAACYTKLCELCYIATL